MWLDYRALKIATFQSSFGEENQISINALQCQSHSFVDFQVRNGIEWNYDTH